MGLYLQYTILKVELETYMFGDVSVGVGVGDGRSVFCLCFHFSIYNVWNTMWSVKKSENLLKNKYLELQPWKLADNQ